MAGESPYDKKPRSIEKLFIKGTFLSLSVSFSRTILGCRTSNFMSAKKELKSSEGIHRFESYLRHGVN